MATIEKFTTGNFDLKIEGDLNGAKQNDILEAGLRYIVQRDGATKAYKTLFGDKASESKRKSLEYSDANAAQIRDAFVDALKDYGTFTVTVSEHIAAESVSSRSMATKMWNDQVKDNSAFRKVLGINRDATDEAGIEACHTFLQSTRKPAAKANGEGEEAATE